MLGFVLWTILGEPTSLRPRELSPFKINELLANSYMSGLDPYLLERIELYSEDSILGVCDPEAYGFRQTDKPQMLDMALWRGGSNLLSRLSRYVSGCRFSHTGVVLDNNIVGHVTLSGYVTSKITKEIICFDCELPEKLRIIRIEEHKKFAKGVKGYGKLAAFYTFIRNTFCFTRKSNIFHFTDTLTYCFLLHVAGLNIVSYFLITIACIRVSINYGIQRKKFRGPEPKESVQK